jgi:hypothetical protein
MLDLVELDGVEEDNVTDGAERRVVLFEFFLLCLPSNVPNTWLVYAIHSAGHVFKEMSILTPIIFHTISFNHAMLFRVQYFL